MFIIAEIGGNHCGDIVLAKEMIYAASESGADMAKFQLYSTELIKSPGDRNFDYLKSVELTKDDMLILNEECNFAGIEFGASVFDLERKAWVDEIDIARYKLASRSINDTQLVNEIAQSGKPVIASIQEGFADGPKDYNFDYLYCVSRTQIIENGFELPNNIFSTYSGFSDHTVGIDWSLRALDGGAKIIEKHFTLDHNLPGWDQPGSATPEELRVIVDYARNK